LRDPTASSHCIFSLTRKRTEEHSPYSDTWWGSMQICFASKQISVSLFEACKAVQANPYALLNFIRLVKN
jgi:hypothetical protein